MKVEAFPDVGMLPLPITDPKCCEDPKGIVMYRGLVFENLSCRKCYEAWWYDTKLNLFGPNAARTSIPPDDLTLLQEGMAQLR